MECPINSRGFTVVARQDGIGGEGEREKGWEEGQEEEGRREDGV